MPIEVTARHMHAGVELQEYARSRAEEIVGEFSGIEHVHVILDVEKRRQIAEFVVQARHHIRAEAAETSESMRSSIDAAAGKVAKQLRREYEKMRDHRPAKKHGEAVRTGAVEDESE